VRFIVELRHTHDNVEGEVTVDGATHPQPFSSWLELLQLLEPPAAEAPTPWVQPHRNVHNTRPESREDVR
jgi:hypothetical protein